MNKNLRTLRTSFSEMIKRVNIATIPTIAKINNRSIFIVEGQDSNKFLQGLITNDINKIVHTQVAQNIMGKKLAIYTLFLNPKGRIVTDAIITKPLVYEQQKNSGVISIKPKKDQFFIDVPIQARQVFTKHLKRYTWKKKVDIQQIDLNEEQLSLFAGYTPNKNTQKTDQDSGYPAHKPLLAGQTESYAEITLSDPRNPVFGVRFLAQLSSVQFKKQDFKLITQQQYQEHQLCLGAASFQLMHDKLPFQFNTDLLDGISFDKGCYLGQQIISRGYLTGIVRRRIFPFETDFSTQKIELDSVLKTQSGKTLGKVIHYSQGNGLALINYLDFIQQKWPLRFDSPIKGRINSPFHWKLLKYYESMKRNKQILENYIQ